jgi:hypothetical protein
LLQLSDNLFFKAQIGRFFFQLTRPFKYVLFSSLHPPPANEDGKRDRCRDPQDATTPLSTSLRTAKVNDALDPCKKTNDGVIADP